MLMKMPQQMQPVPPLQPRTLLHSLLATLLQLIQQQQPLQQ
jgi:hypothetical protein